MIRCSNSCEYCAGSTSPNRILFRVIVRPPIVAIFVLFIVVFIWMMIVPDPVEIRRWCHRVETLYDKTYDEIKREIRSDVAGKES